MGGIWHLPGGWGGGASMRCVLTLLSLWLTAAAAGCESSGMTYHVGYSVAAFVLFMLLVKFAWPRHLEAGEDEDPS